MSFQNRDSGKYKVLEFIKSPLGAILTLGIVVLLALLIAVTVMKVSEGSVNNDYYWYSEVDPASGTEVWFGSPTGGDGADEVTYAGFDTVLDGGVTPEQYLVFRDAVKKYAELNDIELKRISYVKDSYKLQASYVFKFDIVLNIDEIKLGVVIDSSVGWKNINGMFVKLLDDGGEEVFRLNIDSNNICDYVTSCTIVDDGA